MSPARRTRQVRCTTWNDVAIRALPPNVKITAEVFNALRRPKVVHGRSKLSAGKASCNATKNPTANPTPPQKTVASTPGETTAALKTTGNGGQAGQWEGKNRESKDNIR